MSDAEIKTCPFCGEAAEGLYSRGDLIAAECEPCEILMDLEEWNKRPAEEELLKALEELAKLGNGERYGNSDGNRIAQAAIAKAKGTS